MNNVSIHESVNILSERATQIGLETAFDRFKSQQKQCNFGLEGRCCHACHSGPCRLDAKKKGVCGADINLVAARSFAKMVAYGQAAQLSHAWRFSQLLLDTAQGKTAYKIKATAAEIKNLAAALGLKASESSLNETVAEIARLFLSTLTAPDLREQPVLKAFLPVKLIDRWKELGLLPGSSSYELTQTLSRSSFGVEADHFELLLQAVRLGITDGNDIFICALTHDLLHGKFQPRAAKANLGVLKEKAVNIAVQGHVPLLPAVVCELATSDEWQVKAKAAGAEEGLNVVGICCNAHEMLGRYGVAPAASVIQQELALATGAVDAYVIDQQCVYPSLAGVAECFGTAIITTDPGLHLPGAHHVPVDDSLIYAQATDIINKAVEAFARRGGREVFIPQDTADVLGPFTTSGLLEALGGTIDPLIEAIASGQIKGIAVVGTCNNPKVKNDAANAEILKGLIAADVLTLSTGCAAHAAAKLGLLDPVAGLEAAGPGLRTLAGSLGVPPVLHAGSCIYNSLLLGLAGQVAERLGVNIADLPLVVSAPEWVSFKAVSQGTFLVASGVLVHVGVVPPVIGGPEVARILTHDIEGLLGGKIYVEPDPLKAVTGLLDHIGLKRQGLKLDKSPTAV